MHSSVSALTRLKTGVITGSVGPIRRCRVSAEEVSADCGGCGCVCCVQGGGGVVHMVDGAITFKGGTISKTEAVRGRLFAFAYHMTRVASTHDFTLHVAHDDACHMVGVPSSVGPMRIGAGAGGGGAGPIVAGVAVSAVRSTAMAAWLTWTMGPSRSRAA